MYIERPKGFDISDEHVTLTLRDENGLRAGTVTITAACLDSIVKDSPIDVVRISVERVPDDQYLRVEFVSVN